MGHFDEPEWTAGDRPQSSTRSIRSESVARTAWPAELAGAVQSAPASADGAFTFFVPAPELDEGWDEKGSRKTLCPLDLLPSWAGQVHYQRVRYRGLSRNTLQLMLMCVAINLRRALVLRAA